MKIKKVAIFGQNELAIRCSDILRKKNIELSFVVANSSDSGVDSWQPSFKKWALKHNIEVLEEDSAGIIEAVSHRKIDLIFSLYHDKIFRKNLISIVPAGIINLHFSPLPKYRGVAPITLAILNGEKQHGVTLHYIDAGIDRGDIIAEKKFPLTGLSAKEAFNTAIKESIELFDSQIDSILSGKNKRRKQDNSHASYYPMGTIHWGKSNVIESVNKFFNKDTHSIYNWLRAFIFPPLQYPVIHLEGQEYNVISAKPYYTEDAFEKPGTITADKLHGSVKHIKVATHDSYIELVLQKKQ